MATSKKQSRKQLKQPDEFVQTGTTLVGWIGEHRRQVIIAVVAVVAVGFVAAVTASVLSRQAAEAGEDLAAALALADRPVVEGADAAGGESFPTEEARREAVMEALQAVREAHPDTDSAAMAALQLGELAFAADDHEAADAHYRTFLEETGRGHGFRYAGLEGLALIAEARDQDAEAAEAWQRVVDQGNAFYRPFALVQLAETLERLGRTDEARAKAQQVLDSWPESAAATDAQTIVTRLPPAPEAAAPEGTDEPAAPAAGDEG